jgi:hypothetical protein
MAKENAELKARIAKLENSENQDGNAN